MKGWVYIAVNESLKGTIKIGFSDRHPEYRIRELTNTSIPTPFQCAYAAFVENAEQIERMAHRELKDYRVSNDREFFTIEVLSAIQTIQDCAHELGHDIALEEVADDIDENTCSIRDGREALEETFRRINVQFAEWKKAARTLGNDALYENIIDKEVLFRNFSKELSNPDLLKRFAGVANMTPKNSIETKRKEVQQLLIQKCEREFRWFKSLMSYPNGSLAYLP